MLKQKMKKVWERRSYAFPPYSTPANPPKAPRGDGTGSVPLLRRP